MIRVRTAALAILLLSACDEPPPPRDYRVPMKLCLDECLGATFLKFHSKGSSWGTGSSSMNGLSQERIFDRALRYCRDFYQGETCCAFNYRYGNDINITTVHGFDYGACLKEGR